MELAKSPLPEGGFYEDLCFHAQQAAEKAIKCIYIYNGWHFRYVHNLDELLTGLEGNGVVIPQFVKDAVPLTLYAWEARYPGAAEGVTEDDYQDAINLAEAVLA